MHAIGSQDANGTMDRGVMPAQPAALLLTCCGNLNLCLPWWLAGNPQLYGTFPTGDIPDDLSELY